MHSGQPLSASNLNSIKALHMQMWGRFFCHRSSSLVCRRPELPTPLLSPRTGACYARYVVLCFIGCSTFIGPARKLRRRRGLPRNHSWSAACPRSDSLGLRQARQCRGCHRPYGRRPAETDRMSPMKLRCSTHIHLGPSFRPLSRRKRAARSPSRRWPPTPAKRGRC